MTDSLTSGPTRTDNLPPVPIPGGPRPVSCQARPLSQVAQRIGAIPIPQPHGHLNVTGVSLSSRTVRPGDLYAALPGQRAHGADYLPQALAAGAVAVLTDQEGQRRGAAAMGATTGGAPTGDAPTGGGVPMLVVPDPRAVLGELAAWIYGEPGRAMVTFGVTGTNGKTTTTFLLDAALRAAGRTTGLIGTIEIRVGDERVASTATTPEAPDLHALLAVMREHAVSACSMEISSHALAQHRVDGLVLDVAGFTNLSQDHLDYHVSMEAYFAAKAELFTPAHARLAVICVDDPWGRRLADQASIPVITVSTRSAIAADWSVLQTDERDGTPLVVLSGPGGVRVPLHCPLPGAFNVENCVVALAMLVSTGLDAEAAAAAVGAAGSVPGRMERVVPAPRSGACAAQPPVPEHRE